VVTVPGGPRAKALRDLKGRRPFLFFLAHGNRRAGWWKLNNGAPKKMLMKKIEVAAANEARPKAAVPAAPWPALVSYDRFRKGVGVSTTAAWRWRREGWLKTLNIRGRLYLEVDEIARFVARASTGEFATVHKVPSRKAAA